MLLALLGTLVTLTTLGAPGIARRRVIELIVIVCNDDWASRGTNLAECVAAGFDFLLIQEGKGQHYRDVRDGAGRRLLPYTTYGVHQSRKSPALAGSVVVWKYAAFKKAPRRGAGFTFGVKANGILARWIAWVRGTIPGTRLRLWVASAHWPPKRTRRWQPLFSAALWARVRLARLARRLILIGTDSNQDGGPPNLPPGLLWASAVKGSIDGLIHSKEFTVVSAVELPKDTSDHHPQRFVLRVAV